MPEPVEVVQQPRVVRNDGSVPFVAPQPGVDPMAPAHLATKGYADYADTVLGTTMAAVAAAAYQLKSPILTNLSSFMPSTADLISYFVDTIGGLALTPLTSFGRSLIDDADAAAARTTLGLAIGTNVQAYDAELAAIAGLTSAADRGIYFTGSGTASLFTLSSFARTLLDDANAAAAQSTLGLVIGGTVHPASVVLDDLENNVILMGRPGLMAADGGGLSALIDASSASDDDIPVVYGAASGGHQYKSLATLLDALGVPRAIWRETGDPVRTVGASSTTEQAVVSASVSSSSTTAHFELIFWGDYLQNSGASNTSRIRVKLGATTLFDKANAFATTAGRRGFVGRVYVVPRGATNKQRVSAELYLSQALNATSGFGDFGAFAATHGGLDCGDAAEDLTSAKTLSVTHQWDTSNANSYLRVYGAKLIYHP